MPIPNAPNAFIPSAKISEYLLNEAHPVGRGKARWLLSLGYVPDHPETLEQDLLTIVQTSDNFLEIPTRFGTKYIVVGELHTPVGRRASVKTIWVVEGNSPPRLVTVYPEKQQ